MNAYDAIVTRRSTRNYKPVQIAPEQLEKVLTAGRFAPSGGNSQSCHFFVIQNPEVLQNLVDMAQEAFSKMEVQENTYRSLKNSILASKKGNYRFCYNAPTLIVVANQKDYGNHMADTAIAIENMMIEANELNLGSCYINQLYWLNEDPALKKYMQTLGMKETESVYGAVILGYPETENQLPNRTPLERKGNEVTYLL